VASVTTTATGGVGVVCAGGAGTGAIAVAFTAGAGAIVVGAVGAVGAVEGVAPIGTVTAGIAKPANDVSDNTDGGVVADAWCVAPWAVGACRVLNVKIPVVIPVITAMAVVSAMRIRTAPPFVGRATAPGSARWGRAPAIAYAPRTESGKASSVLAYRRRVCGRLCEGPGGCPRSVLALSISRQSRWTGVPRPRQVLVWART
jgi:hypothetical protein